MSSTQFPWTLSGLRLLKTIEEYIEKQGGAEALYEDIKYQESQQHKYNRSSEHLLIKFQKMYGLIEGPDIRQILDITFHQYLYLLELYHERRLQKVS